MKKRKKTTSDIIPDKLLMDRNDIKKICENYISKEHCNNLLGVLFGIISSLIVIFITEDITMERDGVFIIISVISFTLFFVVIILRIREFKGLNLLQDIYDLVIEESDHTAIFLVGKKHKNNIGIEEIELLTEQHGQGAKFLVYLPISDIEDKKIIKEKLAIKLGIVKNAIQIDHIDSYNYIKRTQNGGKEKLIRYEFYDTKIEKRLEDSIDSKFEWINFEYLKKDVASQISNHDIIEYIENHLLMKIPHSFIQFDKKQPIKIIWNITKQCDYKCKICATESSNRKELTREEKAAALLSILSLTKERIKELDFSGGDPLSNSESRKIIKYAINELGREKVYVTTTGKGIQKAYQDNENLNQLLYNCEITIEDTLNGTSVRGQVDYSNNNIFVVNKKYKEYIHNLIINVPIVNPTMPETEIEQLVQNLSNINVYNKQVVLIRLMKVGKIKNDYPKHYDPKRFIDLFIKYAEKYKLKCRLQCALRGKYEDRKCNMLEEKIGIDCEGNVFACAWGGYITDEINLNPFFLGNILEKDLQEILDGENTYKLRRKMKYSTNQCRVFCTLEAGGKQIENQGDVLFPERSK